MRFAQISVFIFLWTTSATYGEPTHTIPTLVERALARSEQIRAAEATAVSRMHAAQQIKSWSNPELALHIGRKSVPTADGLLFGIEASQPLGVAGKRRLRQEIGTLSADAARLETQQTKAVIALNVVRLAYEYTANQQQLQFQQQREKRFELIRAYLASHYFASPQKKAEKELVENRLRNLKVELAMLESRYRASLVALSLYVDFVQEPLPTIHAPWLKGSRSLLQQDWLTKALEANPPLQQQNLTVQQAEKAKSLANRDTWSDITASAFYNEEHAVDTERFVGAGLTLPLPLWNRNAAGVKSAAKDLEAAVHINTFARQQTAAAMNGLLVEYEALRQAVSQFPATLPAETAKTAHNLEQEFRRGRIELLTFLETDNSLADTHQQSLDLQTQFIATIVQLFAFTGNPELVSSLEDF